LKGKKAPASAEDKKNEEEKREEGKDEKGSPRTREGDYNEGLFMRSNEVFGAVKIKDGLFMGD
jgi:hypothetical protein